MSFRESFRAHGPGAILLGAAMCVSCLTVIATALGAMGIVFLPEGINLWWRAGALVLLLVVGGAWYLRERRKALAEGCEIPAAKARWDAASVATSIALSFALVAGVALVAQFAIETFTPYTYSINWFGSVPFLTLGTAWFLHGWRAERASAHPQA